MSASDVLLGFSLGIWIGRRIGFGVWWAARAGYDTIINLGKPCGEAEKRLRNEAIFAANDCLLFLLFFFYTCF